jgi:4-diphosphocytidyl-2-C-methyl-D-erythritol kinase
MSWPRQLVAVAPGKLNLGLEVIGRRPDGYHEVVTVLQAISLYDDFVWTDTGRAFEYAGPPGVPLADDLVWRALQGAADRATWTGRLTVRKRIPLAAGLGGGSSDAALALRLAHPDAPAADLERLARPIGADVAFFVAAGTALATGVGATLTPLSTPQLWFVIVAPALVIANKTRTLYQGLIASDLTDGAHVRRFADGLRAGRVGPLPPNAFERQLMQVPEVGYARAALARAGATQVAVTGAGPAVYACTASYAQAARIAARLPRDAGTITLARSIAPREDDPPARAIAQTLRGAAPRA